MMKNKLLSIVKSSKQHFQTWMVLSRLASSTSNPKPSPVYEIRFYPVNPKDMKTAVQLFEEKSHLRTKHSKLFGFWNSEIGDGITQLVHIWEYDSLSHRRQVRTAMTKDFVWNTEFVPLLTPCLSGWRNALMVGSPESKINTDFTKDPSAVYLLDEIRMKNQKNSSDLPENTSTEILVGRFTGLLGPSNTEYRLWRYADIDEAQEGSLKRATDSPFEGSTLLLYPTKFSPLS